MGTSVDEQMYRWAEELFDIPRSLTGDGVRTTLRYLRERINGLQIHEVPSQTSAFDWSIPDEWNVDDAYIVGPDGEKFADYRDHNLHLVGYSTPVETTLSLDELQPHLHSIPEQPDAIPYVTSYYRRRWGFCLSHRKRQSLRPGTYKVVIRSRLQPGHMTYADLVIPGQSKREVLFSTYICHPSMANNELSGPVVATALARWIAARPQRQLTYRFAFIPETIGAIYYISRHLETLRQQVVAGFQLTCCGDTRTFSLLHSRRGDTVADRVARHVMERHTPGYDTYSFLDRGSDERQYCSPGVDLPMVSIMRSKYREYPEYHTSLDNLELISARGLGESLDLHKKCVQILEANRVLKTCYPCEPQLGRRGLYPTLSTRNSGQTVRTIKNILAYADGARDLVELANTIDVDCLEILDTCHTLRQKGLLQQVGPQFI